MARGSSHHAMPDDAWEFLANDDESNLDDSRSGSRASEEAAIHTAPDSQVVVLRDPAAREVEVGYDDDDAPVARWFDDEEPEPPYVRSGEGDSEDETDLEDILETQHYAFSDEVEPDVDSGG